MSSASTTAGWTSLEVAKLLVQSLVPLAIFALGILIARQARSLEHAIWQQQKGIEWKQSLFDRTIGSLNKLFCAFNYVGSWDELTPPEIIKAKRDLDSEVYGYRKLLKQETMEAYEKLMSAAFATSGGRGKHIQIKANVKMYREALHEWKEPYNEMFVPEQLRTRRQEFNLSYDKFITLFFRDVGI